MIERSTEVGGASGSFEIAGIRVDHGSHRLHPSTDARILRDLRSLLSGDLQLRPRNGRIRLMGRWVAFPLRPTDVVTALPPSFAAEALADALTSPLRRPRRDTFDEAVRAGLGPTMLERFYGPYARKLWGLDPSDLAGEQARRRISAATPAAIVQRILRGADPQARTFLYPRRGFGQIAERLAEDAVAAGADLRLGVAATGLRPVDGGVEVATPRGTVAGRRVFSTVPLPVLARLWGATPPNVLAAARRLRTRSMVLAYAVLDVPRYTQFDAHYLPEATTPVTRISEPKNYRVSRDDPPDRTVLCAEIPCDRTDPIWDADPDALREVVAEALSVSDLPPARIAEVEVRRLPHAYPVYDRGFEAALAVVDGWASSLERVLTFGRQGLHVHDNSHHALAMAWAAVDALDGAGFDHDAWRRARDVFATHVVED